MKSMKIALLASCCLMCFMLTSVAQEDNLKRLKLNKVRVSEMKGAGNIKGILFEIRPSSILISDSYKEEDYLLSNFNVTELYVSNIDEIFLEETIHVHGNQAQYDEVKVKLNSQALIPVSGYGVKKSASLSGLRDTVMDFDKNVYHTIEIGEAVWLAEDLKVTHFRNGKGILEVNDNSSWASGHSSAYCNYPENDRKSDTHGLLYNWYAMTDSSELCPTGWHVPSIDDWLRLINSIGGIDKAGGYLKEPGTSHWTGPNMTLDTTSFIALPGGCREYSGIFSGSGNIGQWWIFNGASAEEVKGLSLFNISTAVMTFRANRNSGLSVRCIRDQ
jgi:uncharacterized protein (TIGR02145 family)